MAVINRGIFIVAGKRTPFGKFGGMLHDVPAEDLFATAATAALRAGAVPPDAVDTVNIGQVCSLSLGGMSPRHAALKAGIPQEKPVLGINLLSGSAFSSIVISAQEILVGSAQISLAGGMETLSSVPYLVRGIRSAPPLGEPIDFEDKLLRSNYDTYCNKWLLEMSDLLALKYGITRKELDEFSLRSQKRWKDADDNGRFSEELAPVTLKREGGDVMMVKDEQPRPDITMDILSQLPVLFKGGVTTAGNACGLNDGAGAVILANEEALKLHNLEPLARLVGWSCVGVESQFPGEGVIDSTRNLLAATGYTIDDIDLIEFHESYSVVAVVAAKVFKVDGAKLNVDGGAISIGHPSGASGARIVSHLTHELRRRRLKKGLASTTIAGGQGLALMIEAM